MCDVKLQYLLQQGHEKPHEVHFWHRNRSVHLLLTPLARTSGSVSDVTLTQNQVSGLGLG